MAHTDNRQIAAILTAGMMVNQLQPHAPTTLALFFQCLDELERMDKQRDEKKIAAQPQAQQPLKAESEYDPLDR